MNKKKICGLLIAFAIAATAMPSMSASAAEVVVGSYKTFSEAVDARDKYENAVIRENSKTKLYDVFVEGAEEDTTKAPTTTVTTVSEEDADEEEETTVTTAAEVVEKEVKDAPKTSFENVAHYFNSLEEALNAYPDAKLMFENGYYVVYTDKAPLTRYDFPTLAAARDSFPDLEPAAMTDEDGNTIFSVWTTQNALTKYTFDTYEDFSDAFFDLGIEPMAEDGKLVVWTNEKPLVRYEFDTAKEARIKFPGAKVMAENGVFVVYSRYEPAQTKPTVPGNAKPNPFDVPNEMTSMNPDSRETTTEAPVVTTKPDGSEEETTTSKEDETTTTSKEDDKEDGKEDGKEDSKDGDKEESKKPAAPAKETLPETGAETAAAPVVLGGLTALIGAVIGKKRK